MERRALERGPLSTGEQTQGGRMKRAALGAEVQ